MWKDKLVQASRRERKELARRLKSDDPGLEVVHPDAAGIDVGNEAHYVAVRGDRDPEPVRPGATTLTVAISHPLWLHSDALDSERIDS